MKCRAFLLTFLVGAFWPTGVLHRSLEAAAQELPSPGQRVLEDISADERIVALQADFPDARPSAHFSPEYGVWIVEFVLEGVGEVGMATIDPDSGRILEFDRREGAGERRAAPGEYDRANYTMGGALRRLAAESWPRFTGVSSAWLSFVVALLLFGNFRRWLSVANVDILLLHALAPFLLAVHSGSMRLGYTGIFCVTLLLFARCTFQGIRNGSAAQEQNVTNTRALIMLVVFACLLHVHTVFLRGIGDVGIWSAVGADFLWQTGRLPYGTEFGKHCIYGPLMYVLFLPANLFAPVAVEVLAPGVIATPDYAQFPMRGVQATVLALDFATISALYLIARRSSGVSWSLGIVVVYSLSPYLLGMVDEMGLDRASHVVGMPFLLFALLSIHRPAAAGALLDIATGMVYYPVFLVPLWLGYLWRTQRLGGILRFAVAYGGVGLVCLGMILSMVHPLEADESAVGAFVDDSIHQQQFKDGYGNSERSFWGQYPTLASWGKPLAGILYLLFCLGLASVATETRLIPFSAAVLVGAQLPMSFAGGTYIGFYLAIVVLTLFRVSGQDIPGQKRAFGDAPG